MRSSHLFFFLPSPHGVSLQATWHVRLKEIGHFETWTFSRKHLVIWGELGNLWWNYIPFWKHYLQKSWKLMGGILGYNSFLIPSLQLWLKWIQWHGPPRSFRSFSAFSSWICRKINRQVNNTWRLFMASTESHRRVASGKKTWKTYRFKHGSGATQPTFANRSQGTFISTHMISEHVIAGGRFLSNLPLHLLVTSHCPVFVIVRTDTLQGTNISHLRKRKIIFQSVFVGDMLVSWRIS